MCSYNDGGVCINPKCAQYEDFCKGTCDRRDEKTKVRKERKMEKLYKVFISYRQPYKTRRWLLFKKQKRICVYNHPFLLILSSIP